MLTSLLLAFPWRSKQGDGEELTLRFSFRPTRPRDPCFTTLGFPVFAWVDRHILIKKQSVCFSHGEASGTSRKGFESLQLQVPRTGPHQLTGKFFSLLLFLLFLRGAVWKVYGDGTDLKNSCPLLYNKSDTKISAGLLSHNSCRDNKEVCVRARASAGVLVYIQLVSQDCGMSAK